MKYLSSASRQLLLSATTEPDDVHPEVGILQLRDVFFYSSSSYSSSTTTTTSATAVLKNSDDMLVLVLDYCSRGELFDVIVTNGYIPTDTALDYFHQLVHAIRFCHNRGVAHRDIKLDNVLICGDGRLKLADFGMSCLFFPQSLLQTACGSPHYCAPEVLSETLYDGYAADVWSLGVVLFSMITGGLPLDDENTTRLMTKIRRGLFYMPAAVQDDVGHVIRRMLDTDPAARITLDEIVELPWFKSQAVRADIYVEPLLLSPSPSSKHVGMDVGIENPKHMLDNNNHNHNNHYTNKNKNKALCGGMNMMVTDVVVVEEPGMDIVTQLAHLGLGDIPTIARRLKHVEPCKEKDFYRVLAQYHNDHDHDDDVAQCAVCI